MSIFRIALLLLTMLPTLSAQQYTLQRFSVPSQTATIATSINNRGAIVGYCRGKGFKRDADGVFEFPITGILQGINDSGVITGYFFSLHDGNYHSFLLIGGAQGKYTIINVPPGPDTLTRGINNLGDFAGHTGDISLGQWHGFVNIAGIITHINVPGATETWATAVASDGSVVGISSAGAFVRGPKGNFLKFQIPGAAQAFPQAINNEAGLIVGTYSDSHARNHGFVYNYVADLAALDGESATAVRTISVQTIDYPGRSDTYVMGVNAKGVLVGYTNQYRRPIFSFTATPVP